MEQQANLQQSIAPRATLSMSPSKFALWLFILSIVMIFASLTSAYLVSKGERLPRGAWMAFELPPMFWFTSALIILSSGTMHWAYISAQKDDFPKLRLSVVITMVLGLLFLAGQVMAWGELVDINVFFTGQDANPAGSYVYVLSGLHGIHIISGLVFLVVLFVKTFQGKVHSKNMNTIEMAATFWHFLDGLWLYLFLFLLFSRI